jgi:hypothetical protein
MAMNDGISDGDDDFGDGDDDFGAGCRRRRKRLAGCESFRQLCGEIR